MRRPSTSGPSSRHRLWYAKVLVLATIVASALTADDDGLESRLYVANDAERRIDVFDVAHVHTLLRSIN